LHLLWELDKPAPADERITIALKKLSTVVGGDPHVCHPAALLRMPGTHNSKFNAWHQVTVSTKV
jgi:hypothetical protein